MRVIRASRAAEPCNASRLAGGLRTVWSNSASRCEGPARTSRCAGRKASRPRHAPEQLLQRRAPPVEPLMDLRVDVAPDEAAARDEQRGIKRDVAVHGARREVAVIERRERPHGADDHVRAEPVLHRSQERERAKTLAQRIEELREHAASARMPSARPRPVPASRPRASRPSQPSSTATKAAPNPMRAPSARRTLRHAEFFLGWRQFFGSSDGANAGRDRGHSFAASPLVWFVLVAIGVPTPIGPSPLRLSCECACMSLQSPISCSAELGRPASSDAKNLHSTSTIASTTRDRSVARLSPKGNTKIEIRELCRKSLVGGFFAT